MAHQRKLIRAAVAAQLSGRTAAGARVSSHRVEPLRKAELPAIGIYIPREQVTEISATTAPREVTREAEMQIIGYVAQTSAVAFADACDDLAEQIEAAMDADRYLGDTAADSVLESCEIAALEEGDPLIGVVILTYAVTYRTLADNATPVDLFQIAAVTHEPTTVLPAVAIVDQITLET